MAMIIIVRRFNLWSIYLLYHVNGEILTFICLWWTWYNFLWCKWLVSGQHLTPSPFVMTFVSDLCQVSVWLPPPPLVLFFLPQIDILFNGIRIQWTKTCRIHVLCWYLQLFHIFYFSYMYVYQSSIHTELFCTVTTWSNHLYIDIDLYIVCLYKDINLYGVCFYTPTQKATVNSVLLYWKEDLNNGD